MEIIRGLPEAFIVAILVAGLALLLSPVFGGRKIGSIELPELVGWMKWLGVALGLALLAFGVLASTAPTRKADIVIRPKDTNFFRNVLILTAENHSDVLAVPNERIGCVPTEGNWTSGNPPKAYVDIAPTFVAISPFPPSLSKSVQELKFKLDWNFEVDPGTLPLRGRLNCTYGIRVNAKEVEAFSFNIVYLETEESSGDYVLFVADRFDKEMTLKDFVGLIPMALQGSQ